MKDLQYYPTPEGLAGRMAKIVMDWLDGQKGDRRTFRVLDPSAGTGALLLAVDKLNEREYQGRGYRRHNIEYLAVEVDIERRIFLEANRAVRPDPWGKPVDCEMVPGMRVVGTDFLAFHDDRVIDVIIANPPFNDGQDHFLHAWELLAAGGLTVHLLNASGWDSGAKGGVIRQLLEDNNGTVEVLQGEFADAERRTMVDVVLIVVEKPWAGSEFDFSGLEQERPDWNFDGGADNGLKVRDVVRDMVNSYEAAKVHFREALKAYHRAVRALGEFSAVKPEEFFKGDTPQKSYDGFVKAMRERGWQLVFQKTGVASVATEKVRRDFEKEMSRQQGLAFTEENIRELLGLVMASRGKVMEEGVVSVFDYLTRYHEENRCHPEGWKTNKAWKVTRKFIIPRLWHDFDNYTYVKYGTKRELDDIDRAMGYLRGRKIDEEGFLTISEVLDGAVKGRDMGWVYSTFFKLRWYKKGTLHCEFLDEELYDDFNRAAMVGKRWLPDLRKT